MLFSLALFAFSWAAQHLISAILILELLSLLIYFSICLVAASFLSELFPSLLFLSLAVTEGVLGLSLVVLLVQKKGNDFLPWVTP